MLQDVLKNYGLSTKEAKIYLAALSMGDSTVQEIAEKSKIQRATAYTVIDSLKEKGLLSTTMKGKKNVYVAAAPDKIIEHLKAQRVTIDVKMSAVEKILPELQSLYNYSPNKPRVRYFEGLDGLKQIYEDTTIVGKTIYAFNPIHKKMSKELLRWLSENYVPKRVKLGIHNKIITPAFHSEDTKRLLEESEDLNREVRIVSDKKFPFSIEIQIYGPKVAIISYASSEMFGVIIESEETSKTWKYIFDLAWEGARQYN